MLEVLSGHTPGRVILFARNIESRDQTPCNRKWRRSGKMEAPWISLDQEGSRSKNKETSLLL